MGEPAVVLGLSTSPRRGGNTETMLDSALEGAREAGARTEKVVTSELDIGPCRGCNACARDGKCVQLDDMQALYPKLLTCRGVILAAPIFSMNLAAQAKIVIDRLQCCWSKKYVLKEHTVEDGLRNRRRGLWLAAAGLQRPDVFDPALFTVKYFFAMLEIKQWEKLTFNNLDEKGAVREVEGALEACRRAGARLLL